MILEQHDHLGGCAGYYRQDGFVFDVGATALVDFTDGGVGGQFLDQIGFDPPSIDVQDAYRLWLPDRTATLYHDQQLWQVERRETFGATERHRKFYDFLDRISEILWELTGANVKLPMQSLRDIYRNARAVGLSNLSVVRYFRWSMADAMRAFNVYDDRPLRRAITMLVEDTVHSTLENAPLLNAALGISIRRTGLGRAEGGMYGFWSALRNHYEGMGGTIKTGQTVTHISGSEGAFRVTTEEQA